MVQIHSLSLLCDQEVQQVLGIHHAPGLGVFFIDGTNLLTVCENFIEVFYFFTIQKSTFGLVTFLGEREKIIPLFSTAVLPFILRHLCCFLTACYVVITHLHPFCYRFGYCMN